MHSKQHCTCIVVYSFPPHIHYSAFSVPCYTQTKGYESEAFDHYDKCVFFGSGTGPTLGVEPCAKNPGVNLLPIDGQLWLTIDTALWGRVDPHTLETINAKVEVRSTVLNAHPACDPFSKECFVQYPCSAVESPYTKQACIGKLVSSAARSAEEGAYMFGENKDDMRVVEVSRSTMSENKIIQHSHSPCVTENYVVSKLDSFGFR